MVTKSQLYSYRLIKVTIGNSICLYGFIIAHLYSKHKNKVDSNFKQLYCTFPTPNDMWMYI